MEKRKNSLVDYEFYYWIYKNDLDLWSKLTDASKEYESEALTIPVVVESFYCNQDDGEYNNNPCAEQCRFCKEAEALQ